jgi:hypothetical protein
VFNVPFSYQITATNSPTSYSAGGLPAGLGVDPATGLISGTPAAVGSYPVTLGATNVGGTGTAPLTLTIAPAPAVVTLGAGGATPVVKLAYDGSPRTPPITTSPAGLSIVTTYDGSTTPPTLPGTYYVITTVSDPNYTGSTEGTLVIRTTAVVRHAPVIVGLLDGSLQLLTGENVALSSSATITTDLLAPGTPSVLRSGNALLAGTLDGPGNTSPSNYSVSLSGQAVVRYLVRRIDPAALPVVAVPPAPTGTRTVSITKANQSAGDFSTLRNLTLSGNAGQVAVPPGTYGNFAASGNSSFVLGVAGATEPAIYNLQALSINAVPGNAKLLVVGPVILTLANAATINGPAGAAAHPEWLALRIASGGLTVSGSHTFSGSVVAPNGTVTLSDGAVLHGTVDSDKLTLNGTSILNDPGL